MLGETSKSLPLNTSIPQGSILGPRLFIIYTSDLPLCLPLECKLFMYADDLTITCIHSSSNINEIENNLNTASGRTRRVPVEREIINVYDVFEI